MDVLLLAALYHDGCGICSRNNGFIFACQGANHILSLPVVKGQATLLHGFEDHAIGNTSCDSATPIDSSVCASFSEDSCVLLNG